MKSLRQIPIRTAERFVRDWRKESHREKNVE